GVRVAAGDVTGDGTPDIITAPGPGGGPDIHVYDGRSGQLVRQFFAFDPAFTGGTYVAGGDVNRDGYSDIIVGAGAGGGPNVRVFSGKDGMLLSNFMAYDARFSGGVRVAGGDVNGDGFADVVCGAGAGGGPNVTVVSGRDGGVLSSFFAADPGHFGGVNVAAGDVNGDGSADVIAGVVRGGGSAVAVFSGATGAGLATFTPYGAAYSGDVRVGFAPVSGGGTIVTGTI